MINESQIRQQLSRYLRKEIDLDQFEDWMAKRSWNMHQDSDEAAQKLASAIELRLAEHSSGHLDECALRDELRSFANPKVVEIFFGNAVPLSIVSVPQGQSNVIAQAAPQVVAFPMRPASQEDSGFSDTSRAVVYG